MVHDQANWRTWYKVQVLLGSNGAAIEGQSLVKRGNRPSGF